MTFNVDLSAVKELREHVLERLNQYTGVQIAENMKFNGQTATRQICGLGFQIEEERLMFLLEFKDANIWCQPTDREYNWDFDPTDFDF